MGSTADALVLTSEKADLLGFSGSGPFAFAGAFPGEWQRDKPLRVTELGFADADEAEQALKESFEDVQPLEWTTVAVGEGYPERFNHAVSEDAVRELEAEEDLDPEKIRTHADADAAAARLGISFEGTKATVAEKVEALKAARGGAALDTTAETPELDVDEGPEPGHGPTDQAEREEV